MKKAARADFSRKKEKKKRENLCPADAHSFQGSFFVGQDLRCSPPPPIFGKSSDDNLFFHLFFLGGGGVAVRIPSSH